MARKYPFSMWVYNHNTEFTPDEMEKWAECGMTVPHTPSFHYSDDLSRVIPFLDKAQELGMQMIANISGVSYGDVATYGAEEVERRMRIIYDAIGGHPALYGITAGDEPSSKRSLEATLECYKIHKKVAPELQPYINLIGDMSSKEGDELGGRSLEEWFKAAAESGATFASQDLYGPMINDNCVTEDLRHLKRIVESAEKAGIEIWSNGLSSAHYAYHKPNEHEILWQITVPAACGCKGTIWFRFYDREMGFEYYGSPIDEFGNKTDTYYSILRSQKRFQNHYGEILMGLRRKSTFMRGKERGVYPVFETGSHDLIDINCYEDAVISFFEDCEGREYMCVVNAYMDMHATIKFIFDPEKCSLVELLKNGQVEHRIQPLNPADQWGGESFYAGQLRLFRIDRK